MLTLFTVPEAETVLSEVSAVANPWFQDFLPIVYIGLGIFMFAVLVRWLPATIKAGFARLFSRHERTEYQISSDHVDTAYARNLERLMKRHR